MHRIVINASPRHELKGGSPFMCPSCLSNHDIVPFQSRSSFELSAGGGKVIDQ